MNGSYNLTFACGRDENRCKSIAIHRLGYVGKNMEKGK